MLTEYKERRFNRVEIAASLGSLEKPCGVERRYHFFGLFDDITSVHLLFSFVNSFFNRFVMAFGVPHDLCTTRTYIYSQNERDRKVGRVGIKCIS